MKKNIDRKFNIVAENATTLKKHTEKDAVLFLAKDKALPATLEFYKEECERLGAEPTFLKSVDKLIGRVKEFQDAHPKKVKVPDISAGKEAARLLK